MSNPFIELVERCASAAVVAEPCDLPALAQLHSNLADVADATAGPNGPAPKGLGDGARRAADLVEQLVLGNTADASAAFKDVCKAVTDLQQLVGLAVGGTRIDLDAVCPAPAASNSEAASTPSAPPSEAIQESPIAESDLELVMEFVAEANGHLQSAEAGLLQLEDEPDNLDLVNAVFRAFHTIKGVSGFLNLRQIGRLAHVAETLLDMARNAELKLVGDRLDVVLAALDLAKKMIAEVEVAGKTGRAPKIEPGLPEMVRRLDAAARLTADAGEASQASPGAPSEPAAEIHEPAADAVDSTAAAGKDAPAGATRPTAEASVKVATDRLDALINTVGELVISQAMVSQDLVGAVTSGNHRLARNVSRLAKITRGLQDLSMSMRMIPIQGVFQKMARVVRDTARKAGKNVSFSQTGGETELDRNVVEAIGDPLVHMVRNAVDHGIEPPDARVKAGKEAAGHVWLSAYHQAGTVVVEVRDDGRGLNKSKILAKAIQAGIVREGQELSDQDIFRLIFHPGLSTAEKITDISGRGVGMDVVKKNVEALRGRIEIQSTPGAGSTFVIRLPLTLAVIDGLVVKVGTERYIIPITSIERSLRPTAAQLSMVQGRGEVCAVRDRLMPLVRLHRLFNVTPVSEDPTRAIVVIVQDGPHRSCLLVDELVGQQQVVIKSLGAGMPPVPGVSGCAILGDGNVSLILDVAGVMHAASN